MEDDPQQAVRDLVVPIALKRRLLAITQDFMALSGPDAGAASEVEVEDDPGSYEDRGLLGRGGMGEVRRVYDASLQRTLALKTLKTVASHPLLVQRFIEEARVMAQLQHPGIPPVHEVGELPDGRPYFTMLEVRGATLTEAIAHCHAGGADVASIRPLVDDVRRVAMAVAYAHDRGVVHRDLKPDNVMRGPFGEVWVMDWGLTRVTGAADAPSSVRDSGSQLTRADGIAGTPAYMAPEQVTGGTVDPRTDVYALGGMLYTVLVGALPRGDLAPAALLPLLASTPAPPTAAADARWVVPPDLDEVVTRSMAADPDGRYPDAGALAEALAAWLDGHKARQRARRLVERAEGHAVEAARLLEASQVTRGQAEAAPDTPQGRWRLLDRADDLEASAEEEDVEAELLLQSARSHAPLPEATEALADRYLQSHAQAEARGDTRAALRLGTALTRLATALAQHGTTRHAAYLKGDGTLTVHTEPSGAQAVLVPLVDREWRLQAGVERALGPTPVDAVPLPRGSYVVELRHPGRALVRYPVFIERGGAWTGRPPGQPDPVAVRLPSAVPEHEIYVPAGWFWAGRNNEQDNDLQRVGRTRVWCDAFYVDRNPVTNAQYIEFLDALVDAGRLDEASRHAPQHGGEVVWQRDGADHFVLGADAQGDTWFADAPVVLVDWQGAQAFARWRAARDGLPWRLGLELEWEKAARGADGRPYPWGHKWHPSFCRMRASAGAPEGPAPVDLFPVDTSVYGVRHCAGNVTEWLADAEPEAFARVVDQRVAPVPELTSRRRRLKGGGWMYRAFTCRVDGPASGVASVRLDYQGFRLFRDAE